VGTAWQELPWDSAFFGVGIGAIDLAGLDEAELRRAEEQAGAAGTACLYGRIDPTAPGAAHTVATAQRLGYRLVDVTVDLQHPTGVLGPLPPTTATVRAGTPDDLDRMDDLLDLIAPWSRFAVDARFGPTAARDLHRAGVERAAAGDDRRGLLVAEEGGAITGLLTLRHPGVVPQDTGVGDVDQGADEGRIDLIATTRPRSGAAQALVGLAVEGFGPGPTRGGPIAARNLASLRFTEQLGYRAVASCYLFHRWLDEPSTPASADLRSGP
jgi:hypothetical protein